MDARIALETGRCTESVELYRRALDELVANKATTMMVSYVWSMIATAQGCAGDHAGAVVSANKGLALAKKEHLLKEEFNCLEPLAASLAALGRSREAYTCSQRIITVQGLMRNNESLTRFTGDMVAAQFKTRLEADSLAGTLARSEAHAAQQRSRTQRIILTIL